ncbi:HAD family hydrolase [Candidatus Parcubacteria bacterium]|jgi:D-glycero-D-manno-heptose 1,7-bisphosphate phosphatase|nr:MAG: HAD family hydrolase [Candidatus Parcubacteria bacterium]
MGKREVKAVFLDRDGVLIHSLVRNGKPYSPNRLSMMKIIKGVPEACHRLKKAGFLLIVVTNQPDVARGKQSLEVVEEMNNRLLSILPIDDIQACYHDDVDNCICRKPKPGLLFNAAINWSIDIRKSYLVGDRWRDIEAGRSAGCTTIFIDYGYDESVQSKADITLKSLEEASQWIISKEQT